MSVLSIYKYKFNINRYYIKYKTINEMNKKTEYLWKLKVKLNSGDTFI